jgi:bifunctional ADP-heptose synthase (sugar kinase/adenylyltransferase)
MLYIPVYMISPTTRTRLEKSANDKIVGSKCAMFPVSACLSSLTFDIGRADKAGICKFPEETQQMLLDKLKNLIATREYHVVVMSDYGQGVFSETTAQFIISNSRAIPFSDKVAIQTCDLSFSHTSLHASTMSPL